MASGPTVTAPPTHGVEPYARGLRRPTAMAFGPDGRLYVAQETGEIVVVRRGSRRPPVLARGFSTPLGLAWSGRRLYVSSQGRLDRLTLSGRRLVRRRTLVLGLPYGRHQQNNVVVRRGRLWIGSGSTCDVCRERDRRSAAILSVRPDGSGLRVVARGLRNPFGLAVQPRTGRLYATVNGRDDLGREPAELLVWVRRGAHYGWPACWPNHRRKRLVGRCRGVARPAAYLEPRSGAGSLAFTADGRTAYVALWGQYDSRAHGRTVVRVELGRNGRALRQSVFARGFEHPLAVVFRRGALYVADHGRGVIYRFRRSR